MLFMEAATADATHAKALRADVGVRFVVGMIARAVPLTRVRRRDRVAAQRVHAIGNRFQVFRANAVPHAAQMVDGEAGRYWANEVFVSPSVTANRTTRPVFVASDPEASVAISLNESSPQPAAPQARSLWATLVDVAKEAILYAEKALLVRIRHRGACSFDDSVRHLRLV